MREATACTERGETEALLRREGIYSSHLAAWRKQLALPFAGIVVLIFAWLLVQAR